MYNRYIPEDTFYTPVEEETPPSGNPTPPPKETPPTHQPKGGIPFSFPKGLEGLSTLLRTVPERLKGFRLDNIDSGDVLLLLILLYLLKEGDDMDLVIALGLVLLMGLGDEK